jgi:hypothetical protein
LQYSHVGPAVFQNCDNEAIGWTICFSLQVTCNDLWPSRERIMRA